MCAFYFNVSASCTVLHAQVLNNDIRNDNCGTLTLLVLSINSTTPTRHSRLLSWCLQEMKDWHRPRMECLVEEGVDFICIETIAAKVCA